LERVFSQPADAIIKTERKIDTKALEHFMYIKCIFHAPFILAEGDKA
jgi:hypothetical protein